MFLFNIEFILIVLKNNINYHPHLDDSLTLCVHAQSCPTLCEPLTAKDCHGLQTAKLLCLWDVPGKNSGVGCQFPLPGGLPGPQIEPASPVQRLYHWATEERPLDHIQWSRSVMSDSLRPHGLYSPPGSSVHGILQTRILEWVAISLTRCQFRTPIFCSSTLLLK